MSPARRRCFARRRAAGTRAALRRRSPRSPRRVAGDRAEHVPVGRGQLVGDRPEVGNADRVAGSRCRCRRLSGTARAGRVPRADGRRPRCRRRRGRSRSRRRRGARSPVEIEPTGRRRGASVLRRVSAQRPGGRHQQRRLAAGPPGSTSRPRAAPDSPDTMSGVWSGRAARSSAGSRRALAAAPAGRSFSIASIGVASATWLPYSPRPSEMAPALRPSQIIGEPENPGPMPVASTAGPDTRTSRRGPPEAGVRAITSRISTSNEEISVPLTTESAVQTHPLPDLGQRHDRIGRVRRPARPSTAAWSGGAPGKARSVADPGDSRVRGPRR